MNTVHVCRYEQKYWVTIEYPNERRFAVKESLESALAWGARERGRVLLPLLHHGYNDFWRDPSNYSNRY